MITENIVTRTADLVRLFDERVASDLTNVLDSRRPLSLLEEEADRAADRWFEKERENAKIDEPSDLANLEEYSLGLAVDIMDYVLKTRESANNTEFFPDIERLLNDTETLYNKVKVVERKVVLKAVG
jgi:hypothetical protein